MINWILKNFKTFLDLTLGKKLNILFSGKRWKLSKIRSYNLEVLSKIKDINFFDKKEIGLIDDKYKVYALEHIVDKKLPTLVLTGGVHGSEPAGVYSILQNLEKLSKTKVMNLIIIPCINPYGFEMNIRENSRGQDVNRDFMEDSDCEEANNIMNYLKSLDLTIKYSLDLHETAEEDIRKAGLISLFDRREHISDGIFIYQSHKNSGELIGKQLINELKSHKFKISSKDFIWEEPCIDGCVTYPEARISPLYSAKGSLEDFCVDNLCDVAMTMETMAYEDLEERIRAMSLVIHETIYISY